MSKNTSKKDWSNVISAVLILLLALAFIGYLFAFTENLSMPLKNFYVRRGNDDIMQDRENYDIVIGKEYKFEVVNTLGDGKDDYIVYVTPNESAVASFTFTAGETEVNFQDMDNLGKGFTLIPYEDYFTFTANKDLQEILQLYYPASTLSGVPTALDSDIPYFCLVIKTSESTQVININFNLVSE
jgi:hypothetical protein